MEPEWGFPKGRRNIDESDITCARREFFEETRLDPSNITIYTWMQPIEEMFFGINRINYKHVYYVARMFMNKTFATLISQPPMITQNEGTKSAPSSPKATIRMCEGGKTTTNGDDVIGGGYGPPRITIVDASSCTKIAKNQCEQEIRCMKWFKYDDVIRRIRKENNARLNMFKTLHERLLQGQMEELGSS
jgi:ADP-ribose pyrophosphatase YjhB (NUDIX family)